MYELPSEIENTIREYAAQEGVSINELLARNFPPRKRQSESPDVTAQRVQGLLTKWQSEYGLPVPSGGFKTASELFDEWAVEDSKLSPEELEADRRFWEQREREYDNASDVEI